MSKSFEIPLVGKGILIAVVISLILTLVLSLIYFFTSVSESFIYSLLCAGIGVFAASFYIANKAGSKGLIYGISIGLGFFLFTIITFFIFYSEAPSLKIIVQKLLICLFSGGLGGIIGAVIKS